jgi:hypothetical protein
VKNIDNDFSLEKETSDFMGPVDDESSDEDEVEQHTTTADENLRQPLADGSDGVGDAFNIFPYCFNPFFFIATKGFGW